LFIPAIHLEAPIIPVGLTHHQVNGQTATTWTVPDHFAAGWHDGSALPGQGGNTVLNGHQDVHGAVFQNLDQLAAGDEILVYAGDVAYRYRVAEKHLVAEEGQPSAVRARNVRWILPTRDERLTLVTCAPAPHSDHRLIVVAHPAP
jgi:sortase A